MERKLSSQPLNNSSHEQLSTSSVELNKKRKLQSESGLPSPKHKCRGRSDRSCHGSPTFEDNKIVNRYTSVGKEDTGKNVADDELDQAAESDEDSNSFIEGYETFFKAFHHDKASTSSNSFQNNAFKNGLYSLESRSIINKDADAWGKLTSMHGKDMDLDAADVFKLEAEDTEDNESGFGMYDDYITGFENIGMNVHAEGLTDDAMLYSNDMTSNEFVLSSGRWSVRQDARLGVRKPTIDQEFEQYFSMLML